MTALSACCSLLIRGLRLRGLLGLLLLGVLAVNPAGAATCASQSSGSWGSAVRWNCGAGTGNGPPADGDEAVVYHSLTLNVSTNDLAGLTVNSSGAITHDGNSRSIYLGGDLLNNGSINVTGGANGRVVLLADSIWSGSGTLAADYVDLDYSRLTFAGGTTQSVQLSDATPLRNVDSDFFNPTGNASATLWLNGTVAQTIDANALRMPKLRLSGSVKTVGSASQFILYGDLTVDSGATFNAATNNPTVYAYANLVLNGTFQSGTGWWRFDGSLPQTISAAASVRNMVLNNPQGLTIGGNLTVGSATDGNLTLSRGLLTTGAYAVVVLRECQSGAWLTRSVGSWVNGQVQLALPNYATNCVYPVGDQSNYAPLTLSYAYSSGLVAGNVTAGSTTGDHPDSVAYLSGLDPARSVNRYWTLTRSSGTYPSFDVTLQYCAVSGTADCGVSDVDGAATPANFLVTEKVGSSWTSQTPTAPTSNSRKVTGLTGFGDFAIGGALVGPRLAKTVSTPSALVGDVVTFTVTASNPGGTALPAFVVTDVLPAGMTHTSSVASSGTIVVSGQTVSWTVPALSAGGSAQLTLAVTPTLRGVYTNTVTTPNAAPASASLTVLPGAITHYRMDEAAGAWNGTAGEVTDSGGNNLNGWRVTTTSPTSTDTVVPNPTIRSQYSGVVGDFCNAASFDGRAVVRVANNPKFNYTNKVSASAWIYPTAYPSGASDLYAILSNDRNYEFHLTPSGKLYWWWEASTLTSATTIPLNKWTHVAITYSALSGVGRQLIYINGVPDTNTNNYAGNLSPNLCNFHIGGDVATGACTLRTERNFRGMIDEVKLYDYELSAAEVQADMLLGRTCPGVAPLDHVRIVHDGAASVCTPETVTIKACADAACSTLYTGSVTTTLSPSGWSGGDTVTLTNGLATKQLARSTAGNVTLSSGATSPTPTANTRCFVGTNETCTLNFAAASCTFDAVEVGASPKTNIYTKLSDTAFNLDILALTTAGAINTSYTGTVAVDLVDASSSACPTGTGMTTASNLTFASSNAGRKTQSFTLAGKAAPNVRVRIQAGAAAPACSTDSFTIRPQSFSAVSSSANADATGGVSATPTVKAGAAFTLTADTGKPGYNGKPKVNADSVEWPGSPSYDPNIPGSGVGVLAGASGSLTFANAAVASSGNGASGNFTYSEVGYFRFAQFGVYDDTFPSASNDANNGDCIAGSFANTLSGGKYGCNFGNVGQTAFFGRFIPDHFDTGVTQGCVAGNFTYSGQPIPLTITARNLAGGVTVNYDAAGGFAKDVTLIARDTGDTTNNPGPGAWVSALVPAAGFSGGLASAAPTYAFTSPQTVPTSVRIRASDGEVSSLTTEGVANLRSGRIRLQNANGSELLALPVPLQIQYWSGAAGWQPNAVDTCTLIRASDFAFAFPAQAGNNLAACETRMQVGVVGAAPNYTATLSAPGAGNNGWADLTLNLGAVAAGNQCTVVGGAGGAATTVGAPWLQFNWAGAVGNLTARATFGVYRSGPVIHRREVFR